MVLMLFPSCVYLITCCDCDQICDVDHTFCDFVTESHNVFPCSTPVVIRIKKLKETKKKKKKKKKIENRNDLDILPSHDNL